MNVIDAAHATVRNYPGGSESLAPRIGMSPAILRNKVNPNSTTHRLAIEEANAVMSISQDYRILHALAAEHGFVMIKAEPDSPEPGSASVLDAILRTQATEGQLSSVLQAALADGAISPNELKEISQAVFAVHSVLNRLVSRCSAATNRPVVA